MDTLTVTANPFSVLVVDEEPSILIFLARALDAGGIRALLARNGSEALEIAGRNYIPIDLILINAAILKVHEPELPYQLRQIRPGTRHMCMAACVDGGVIRIQLTVGDGDDVEPTVCDGGLVESIRRMAGAPLVQRAGRPN